MYDHINLTDEDVLTAHLMREGWKSVQDCAALRCWITRISEGHYRQKRCVTRSDYKTSAAIR